LSRPAGKPNPFDQRAVIDFIRQRGSVAFYVGSVPSDFVEWRRGLRQAAKRADLRLSVLRRGNTIWVLDPDYEPSNDEMRAIAEVVGSMVGGELVTLDQALHDQRRSRVRLIESD
jgi:hypothetical protein